MTAPPRTICVSHATGARGPEVARAVADRLGYRYVDDEVISEAAEWAELSPAFVADAERRRSFAARLLGGQPAPVRLTAGDPVRDLPNEADLRDLITNVLHAIAAEGGVVIVAHAASFALAGDEVLRVLVTGSPGVRARRVAAERGVDERTAERAIKDEDAGRSDYLKRFYRVDRELPTHYDVVVNTDVLEPAAAAAVLVTAAGGA